MSSPALFRVIVEVADLERARTFYATLLGVDGRAVGGGRVYFDCGPVILALLDPQRAPQAGDKDLYFAVPDLEAVHARARELGCLSRELVHGAPAGDIVVRPWRERSFYAVDPWGNRLCFVDSTTKFTG